MRNIEKTFNIPIWDSGVKNSFPVQDVLVLLHIKDPEFLTFEVCNDPKR